MKNIVISVCTYRRPEALKTLFMTLKTIRIPKDLSLSIRVIDNEETPSAKALVHSLNEEMQVPVHYVHEKDPGIAPARNRALSEALQDDFLVFVDDDETVSPQWIEELWRVQNLTNAHFVQGPVTPTVEDPQDSWWIKTLLFTQKTFPDCAPRHEAWSNNVMIDMGFIRKNTIQFDPALRFDGGEDTLFFQEIIKKGGQGVFAANADVFEIQPKNRLNWKWALARQFRNGNTRAMIARRLKSPAKAILYSLLRAGACAGLGGLILPLALVKGRIGLANAMTYLARSVGILWGLLGKTYLEYARPITPKEKAA